jgi:hypothetical protein
MKVPSGIVPLAADCPLQSIDKRRSVVAQSAVEERSVYGLRLVQDRARSAETSFSLAAINANTALEWNASATVSAKSQFTRTEL